MQPTTPATDREAQRIEALYSLGILDTPAEALLDSLTRATAAACRTPIALLNLVDRDRLWAKSQVGMPGFGEVPREDSICTLVVESGKYLEIPDTRLDPRVSSKPCVSGEPPVLFYAGAPLLTADGHVLGSLCVLDEVPRAGLAEGERAALQELARTAMQSLLLRKAAHRSLHGSSEQMFRELSETCPVGIFHSDASGKVIYVNPEGGRIFGRTREDLQKRLDMPPFGRPALADKSLDEKIAFWRDERNALIGNGEEIAAQIAAWSGAGVQEIMTQWFNLEDITALRQYAEDVLPRLE